MIRRVRPRWPVTAAALYVVLLIAVLAGWLRTPDRAVADAFRTFGAAHPTLIDTTKILTDTATTIPFLLAGLTVGALLWVRHQPAPARLTLAATALVPVLWSLSHLLVPHSRPPDAFIAITSNGFPSGHTANATTAALLAVLLLTRPRAASSHAASSHAASSHAASSRFAGSRALVWACAIAFAVLIGLSRLLLLAHYPSQVLGGFLLAAAVVPALANLIAGRAATRSSVTSP